MKRFNSKSSDSELISSSLDEPELFGEIFDRHAHTIAKYLTRRVGPDTTETLLSEVFATAFLARSSFDLTKTNALPWLYGIAYNMLRHHYRTQFRERNATEKLFDQAHTMPTYTFEDATTSALDAAAQYRRVAAAIDAAPEIDREVILLYVWEELSYAEIADVVEIPVGTVRSRLNRLRRNLRELEDKFGQEPKQRNKSSGFERQAIKQESGEPHD